MQYQQSFLTCPSCHRDQSVQKVSAIVASGTTTGTTQGIQFGYVHTSLLWRHRFTGRSILWNQQQTQLAAQLAPPEMPRTRMGWVAAIGSLVFALPLLSLGPQAVSATVTATPSQGVVTLDLALLTCATAIALLVAVYVRGRPQRQQKMRAWLDATARWQSVLYCHRCDVVFIPGVRGFVPPQAIHALLH